MRRTSTGPRKSRLLHVADEFELDGISDGLTGRDYHHSRVLAGPHLAVRIDPVKLRLNYDELLVHRRVDLNGADLLRHAGNPQAILRRGIPYFDHGIALRRLLRFQACLVSTPLVH